MNKTKHTPGPWVAEDPGYNTKSSLAGNPILIQGPVDKESFGEELASLRLWSDHNEQNEQQRANARLIAAAPELLEAAKLALAALQREIDITDNEFHPATMRILKAAIAKAEGKGE